MPLPLSWKALDGVLSSALATGIPAVQAASTVGTSASPSSSGTMPTFTLFSNIFTTLFLQSKRGSRADTIDNHFRSCTTVETGPTRAPDKPTFAHTTTQH